MMELLGQHPGSLNTGRTDLAGCRYSNSCVSFWWRTPPITAVTEEYDGNSWATVNSLNTARLNLGGAGTQTAALAFGGRNPSAPATGATELYDGNKLDNFKSNRM
jgi:hypothetical protein